MQRETLIIEILTIGTEILDGRVIDTNASKIARALKQQGLIPRFAQRVDDHTERMAQAFQVAESRSKVILVTGGLGPTSDDKTLEVFSSYKNKALEQNDKALEHLKRYLGDRGRECTSAQLKQSYLPAGSEVLANEFGTACGVHYKDSGVQWFFMPGVPHEMLAMLETSILTLLPRDPHRLSRNWATHFVAEATLEEKLSTLPLPAHWELTYQTRFPENHIGLHASCESSSEKKQFEDLCSLIEAKIEPFTFATSLGAQHLPSLEETVLKKLKKERALLWTVESCTGGLIAHRLTKISGSSESFWGSWITYNNRMKQLEMGVSGGSLQEYGAVSEEVCREMLLGAFERIQKEMPESLEKYPRIYILATTGIAGPLGGSPEKPVGLCYVGVLRFQVGDDWPYLQVDQIEAPRLKSREENQLYFSQYALSKILSNVEAPY